MRVTKTGETITLGRSGNHRTKVRRRGATSQVDVTSDPKWRNTKEYRRKIGEDVFLGVVPYGAELYRRVKANYAALVDTGSFLGSVRWARVISKGGKPIDIEVYASGEGIGALEFGHWTRENKQGRSVWVPGRFPMTNAVKGMGPRNVGRKKPKLAKRVLNGRRRQNVFGGSRGRVR